MKGWDPAATTETDGHSCVAGVEEHSGRKELSRTLWVLPALRPGLCNGSGTFDGPDAEERGVDLGRKGREGIPRVEGQAVEVPGFDGA